MYPTFNSIRDGGREAIIFPVEVWVVPASKFDYCSTKEPFDQFSLNPILDI
jgi:hypothetical protein